MTGRPRPSFSLLSPRFPAACLLRALVILVLDPRLAAAQGVVREELPPSPAYEERARGVIREELDPVMAADGSGLPHELWRGLSLEAFAAAVAALELPPRSPALNGLWRRLLAASSAPGAGADAARFTAMRVEALERSGLVDEVAAALNADPEARREPLLAALAARSEVGLGNGAEGCEIARGVLGRSSGLPKPMQADIILISGFCAAEQGDRAAAGIQAGLLRELDLGLAGADLLDAVAAGLSPEIPAATKLSLLDYRVARLGGAPDRDKLVAAATPALLAGLARDPHTPPDVRLAAGEAAAALGILPARDLAPLYRAEGAGGDAGTIERAGLFKSAEAAPAPLERARLIRAFLDEARRAGLYWPALELMAGPTEALAPAPEIAWFAETAIEVGLASGRFESARRWARFAGSPGAMNPAAAPPLAHWIALADIADPAQGAGPSEGLGAVEQLALRGRFDPALLHRLTTVLDALDMPVPLALWDLAGRAPQPAGGHLPDTGVLSELADASQKKEFGRTVLLVLRTLGPDGAEGAHMIALGDALRALKRAGLEAEARRLGLEGLFGAWPRTVSQ